MRIRFPSSSTLCFAFPIAGLLAACAASPARAPETPHDDTIAATPRPAAPSVPATADTADATPTVAAPTVAPCPRAATLDTAALHDEVQCLLQRYVRLDTTNPPGNERRGADFLAAALAADGIEAQILESAPGRANLYARLRANVPGKPPEGKALMLVHHMDVVPALASEWSVPPFAAEAKDGAVWGRGALDNKGGGVMALATMLMLKRTGAQLPRDLVLLGVADEEAGGGLGARWLLDQHPELFSDVGYALNEGGGILELGEGRLLYSVELAQKAPLWLRITAIGKGGHGSSPHPSASTHVLARALGRLEAHRFPIHVLPEVQAVFSQRAQALPAAERAPMLHLSKALKKAAFRDKFLDNPSNAALVRNTLSITMLSGSDKENVLPGSASAVLDLRLLPGEDPAAVTAQVVKVMAEPSIRVETLLSWQAHASPRDTPLFAAIEALAAKRAAGTPVAANVIGGFTDCNAFRAKDIPCYGFLPLHLGFPDIHRIHGADERLSIDALTQAVVDMVTLAQMPFDLR